MKNNYNKELMFSSNVLGKAIDSAFRQYPLLGPKICELLIDLKLREIIAKQNINYDVAEAKHLAQATEDLIEVINAFVNQDREGTN